MLTACPLCLSRCLGNQWVGPGRLLQQYCYDCGWHGARQVPETKLIQTTREVVVGSRYAFNYEVYDRFGHVLIYSKSYNTENEAIVDLKQDLALGLKDEEAGPYKAVLWPATVQMEGKLFVGGT